jgi:hypothetical protein
MFNKSIISLIISICFSTIAFSTLEISPELAKKCALAGGKAKVFSTGCTDTCYYEWKRKREGDLGHCAMIVTPDCDCGPDKCLDDEVCIANSSYHHRERTLEKQVSPSGGLLESAPLDLAFQIPFRTARVIPGAKDDKASFHLESLQFSDPPIKEKQASLCLAARDGLTRYKFLSIRIKETATVQQINSFLSLRKAKMYRTNYTQGKAAVINLYFPELKTCKEAILIFDLLKKEKFIDQVGEYPYPPYY